MSKSFLKEVDDQRFCHKVEAWQSRWVQCDSIAAWQMGRLQYPPNHAIKSRFQLKSKWGWRQPLKWAKTRVGCRRKQSDQCAIKEREHDDAINSNDRAGYPLFSVTAHSTSDDKFFWRTNLSQNPGFEGQCNLSEYLDTSHQGQSRICDRGNVLSCGFVANTWRLSFVDKLIVGTSSVSSPGPTFRRGLSVRASIY